MTTSVKSGELIPVEDRVRWMLLCRGALTTAVLLTSFLVAVPRGHVTAWIVTAVGWLVLNVAVLPLTRRGRRWSRSLLTVALLGDGVLLGAAWWATGALGGPVSYLVVLHAVAVTLLAAFRTGVKLALWHSMIALIFLEAAEAGMLGASAALPVEKMWLYLAALWTTVLGTASFAAMNERELRRRRYDSEVLRGFGLAIAAAPAPFAVAQALARFATEELLAPRSVVLMVSHDGGDDRVSRGIGVAAGRDAPPVAHEFDDGLAPPSVIGEAIERRATVLRSELDRNDDPWLAGILPGARDLVIVPFVLEEVRGALVLEIPLRRGPRRVERRFVTTVEQATAHAGIALERAVLTDQIRAASQTDGLTRVANRSRFDQVLAAETARSRETGAGLALVMIDIDHFKRLNDTFGHLMGDEVLRLVAREIRAACAEPHLIARYGGEEFAAVLIGVDSISAMAIAERLRAAVAATQTVADVTASLGVAIYPVHGERPTDLLAAADAALYRAKDGGRNRVLIAGPTVNVDAASGDRASAGRTQPSVGTSPSTDEIASDGPRVRR